MKFACAMKKITTLKMIMWGMNKKRLRNTDID